LANAGGDYLIARNARGFLERPPTMKFARAILCIMFTCGLLANAPHALGQDKRAMRKASELVKKQPPPSINKSLAAVINPDNSRVLVSLGKQRAYLMVGDEVYIDTPISSGKRQGMTPTGSFKIMEKDRDHRSSLYGDFVDGRGRVVRAGISLKVDSAPSGTRYVGAPMRWFCRFNGAIGMHVGILPGYPASHGCVRLPAEIAPLIYERVKVGTPVDVVAE
jgi:lipoprotein-anchoring transpeptidase ErfK/SrfK